MKSLENYEKELINLISSKISEKPKINRLKNALIEFISTDSEHAKTLLDSIFDFTKRFFGLNISLKYSMPEGFEDAGGISDPLTGNISINPRLLSKNSPTDAALVLLHELRHSIQYAYSALFSKAISLNSEYVLQYDGTAYKITDGKITEVRLCTDEEYYILADYYRELYLASPAELDANDFAYRILSSFGKSDELEDFRSMWSPSDKYFDKSSSEEEFMKAVEKIDRLTAKEHKKQ